MKISEAVACKPYAYISEEAERLEERVNALPFGDSTLGEFEIELRTDPRADDRYAGAFGEIVGMGLFILASKMQVERFWKREPPSPDFEILLRTGETVWIEYATVTPRQWAMLQGQTDYINYGIRKYILDNDELSDALEDFGVEIRLPPAKLSIRMQNEIIDELKELTKLIPSTKISGNQAFGASAPTLRALDAWWYAWEGGSQFICWCDLHPSASETIKCVTETIASKNGRTYQPPRPWLFLHLDGRLPWPDRITSRARKLTFSLGKFSRIAFYTGRRVVYFSP